MLKPIVALVISMTLTTANAAATTENCLSESEGTAVFAAMLPDLIDGLRDKCATHLGNDGFLVRNADVMIARYKVEADDRWPTAKLAFARIAGQADLVDKLPDEYFRPMLGAMIGAELVKDIKAEDCPGVSRVVENLAPLPAENVAALIGAILMLAENEKDQDKSLPMCKA